MEVIPVYSLPSLTDWEEIPLENYEDPINMVYSYADKYDSIYPYGADY